MPSRMEVAIDFLYACVWVQKLRTMIEHRRLGPYALWRSCFAVTWRVVHRAVAMFSVDETELRHFQVRRDVDRVRQRSEVHRVHGVSDCHTTSSSSSPSSSSSASASSLFHLRFFQSPSLIHKTKSETDPSVQPCVKLRSLGLSFVLKLIN